MARRATWKPENKKCRICGKESPLIAKVLGVCPDCIRERFHEALRYIYEAHRLSRERFSLPYPTPSSPDGKLCGLCARMCRLRLNEVGYCGLVVCRQDFRIVRLSGGPEWGVLDWYYDPLPTNCVAEWFCPASTGIGYPKYAVVKDGPEIGYYNLAVFYGSCNLDCLYCQNWQYREYHLMPYSRRVHVDELVRAADERVTCVCYFGGDPSSQMVHALLTSKKILERARKENRIIRICWETNGQVNMELFRKAIELSKVSGGIVKIDIKAGTPQMYKALTDGDFEIVKRAIQEVARHFKERPEVPLLNVSLLVVPGYIDEIEVEAMCKFLNEVCPEAPVSLLAFHPDYMMTDLPPTSRRHMDVVVRIVKEYGFVYNVGNRWLLGDYY